tara:strand:+ start:341 stop:520 length:180 start_codon:yes stop_codon:yes gene_type:complete
LVGTRLVKSAILLAFIRKGKIIELRFLEMKISFKIFSNVLEGLHKLEQIKFIASAPESI